MPRWHKCYSGDVDTSVGLRELRQDASDLVRRAQAGEEITITVSGRPSARLVPPGPTQWRRWDDVAELFAGPADPDWEHDRSLVGDDLRDPWAER
ncbi:MAG: type II toxin-antitoxin system prevent-host-death family antitoxin [Micropruina sp.]|nr:type II toxin-antitoxin system prevent-host-death family antitoxin [Micropruina sp.]